MQLKHETRVCNKRLQQEDFAYFTRISLVDDAAADDGITKIING